jgi:alpha-mannosidase
MDQVRRLRRLERQIWELFAWHNVTNMNLEPWTAIGASGAVREVKLGERWDVLDLPVRLEMKLASAAPSQALLEFIAEGDGLVFLDGKLAAALNPYEREVPLNGARQIAIEISPNDAFGETVGGARLIMARIVEPDRGIRALHRAQVLACETCVHFPDHQLTPLLIEAITESLAMVRLPSDADLVLKRAARLREELELNLDAARALDRHYGYMIPRRSIERMLLETAHLDSLGIAPASDTPDEPVGVWEALDHLNRRVAQLAKQFPSHGGLAATAHAHLDVAWLWPFAETKRKNRHTFASVLSLMERYPNFHFTASSAQLFTFVQQDDPELFERIRLRVAEGRIEPIGGMWLEPDCNLTSGEALVRHLLYGQRYFDREFGMRSTVAWLPDTFGLAASLPSKTRSAVTTAR